MNAARVVRIANMHKKTKVDPRKISWADQSFIIINKPAAHVIIRMKAMKNSLVAANWSSDLPAKGGLSPSNERRVLSIAGIKIMSKPAMSHPFLLLKIVQSVVSIRYPNDQPDS